MPSGRQLRYKPPAIRVPSLLAYFSVFALCVGLIEWLLADATHSASLSKTSKTSTTAVKASTALDKRYLTTITTWSGTLECDEFYDMDCDWWWVYDYELAWLKYTYAEYCNYFSTVFLPYSRSMPAQLTAELNEWNELATSNINSYLDIFYTSRVCSNPASACSQKWILATASKNAHIPYPFTIGCSSTMLSWDYGCWGSGGYTIVSGTSLTSEWSEACGAPHISQMVITTQIDEDDDPDNDEDAARIGQLTYVPITSVPNLGGDATENVYTALASSAPSIIPPTTSLSDATFTAISKSWTTMVIPSGSISSSFHPLALSSDFEFYEPDLASSATDSSASLSQPQLINPTETSTLSVTKSTSGVHSSITSAPTLLAETTKALSSSSTSTGNHTKGTFHFASDEVMVKSQFRSSSYFAAVFLPPILAVFLKSYWEMLAASLKMIEPFERLQESVDSTAQYSILAQYLSSIVSLDAFRALGHGRLLPIWTFVMYIMLEIVAPLAASSMTIRTAGRCHINGELRPCDPRWLIYVPMIRAVEAILILCMVLILCILWSTRKVRIAVASNPSSVASVAALLNYEPLIRVLQDIDPEADDATFVAALDEYQFRMDIHQNPSSGWHHSGIVTSHVFKQKLDRSSYGKTSPHTFFKKEARTSYMPVEEQGGDRYMSSRRRPRQHLFSNAKVNERILAYLHILTTAALLSLITGYFWDSRTDGFNKFFNSQGIWPKLILVGLATIVDIQMKNLERVVRVTEPYRRMALRNARPETTILLPLNGTCWSNLPRCLYLLFRYEFSQGRMLWQTVVSIVAALSDFNIIVVAGVLFVEGQTPFSYAFCAYSSIVLTGFILIVALLSAFWWSNAKVIRRMPRQPDTIGAIFSYLCGSELIRDWISHPELRMEVLSAAERDAVVKGMERRYCFGRLVGTDDKERWCIDYERQLLVIDRAVQMADPWEVVTPISQPPLSQIPRRKPIPQYNR